MIRREVVDAITQGRTAKRVPRWACRDERYRSGRAIRHAWPEDESRCYIIARRGKQLSVVTVLAPGSRLLDVVATTA